MRILIAEDDPTSARLAEVLLSNFGEINVTTNGQEAVLAFEDAIEQHAPYDLILLDIMMPLVSGQEALGVIREIEAERGISVASGVKVVMCTALSDSSNIYQAHAQGCAEYLNKPLSKAAVIKTLTKLGLIT